MPYKDKQKQKEYYKNYYEKNIEKKKEQKKEWYEVNKEQIKEYFKTPQGKKIRRIKNWKHSGLISEDYDKIYEIYVNTWECDNCGIELVEGNYGANRRCMDHNHRTGEFRNILCGTCNIMRPDYESD